MLYVVIKEDRKLELKFAIKIIKKLKKFGVEQLIEIDADWILNQTKIPSQLKYKRLI